MKKGIPEKSEKRPWRWGERNGVDLSQTVFSWWPFLIAHLPAFRHRAACHYLYTFSLLLLAGAAMISSVLCLFPRTPTALKTSSGVSCGCRHCFCVGLSADVSGLSFQDWPSSGGRVTNSYALSDRRGFFFGITRCGAVMAANMESEQQLIGRGGRWDVPEGRLTEHADVWACWVVLTGCFGSYSRLQGYWVQLTQRCIALNC